MRYLPLVLAAVVLGATDAGAQRRREAPRDSHPPSVWLSLSGGWARLGDIADGSTGSDWEFGDAWPFRVSLEKAISNATIGLQLTYLRAPLLYRGTACGACDAHATIAVYGPMLRLGAGRASWYHVMEIGAGVAQFGRFERDDTDQRLPPLDENRDFAVTLGYGVAFPLGRDWELELMGTSLMTFHERTNLPGNAETFRQHSMLRAGLRVGY